MTDFINVVIDLIEQAIKASFDSIADIDISLDLKLRTEGTQVVSDGFKIVVDTTYTNPTPIGADNDE